MRTVLAIALMAICPFLQAQQQLNNESVIGLVKAGLSEDLIIATVNASPGAYDVSANGIIALKSAGLGDKAISAVVRKTYSPENTQQAAVSPEPPSNTLTTPVQSSSPVSTPRVFLQSASKGTNQNALRDQSMEMSKDLERDCQTVRVTINQQAADYVILLNHIEVGAFIRDNQIQVANKDGDLLSKTKEGGSIAGAMKKACALIGQDWAKRSVH
jgi:hypothetical protein